MRAVSWARPFRSPFLQAFFTVELLRHTDATLSIFLDGTYGYHLALHPLVVVCFQNQAIDLLDQLVAFRNYTAFDVF